MSYFSRLVERTLGEDTAQVRPAIAPESIPETFQAKNRSEDKKVRSPTVPPKAAGKIVPADNIPEKHVQAVEPHAAGGRTHTQIPAVDSGDAEKHYDISHVSQAPAALRNKEQGRPESPADEKLPLDRRSDPEQEDLLAEMIPPEIRAAAEQDSPEPSNNPVQKNIQTPEQATADSALPDNPEKRRSGNRKHKELVIASAIEHTREYSQEPASKMPPEKTSQAIHPPQAPRKPDTRVQSSYPQYTQVRPTSRQGVPAPTYAPARQPQETVVTVSIGRVEVKAIAPKEPLPRSEFTPPLSLSEYLKRRNQGANK